MKLYQILGVESTASIEEISIAYRLLAQKKHPDKGGSQDEFQEICNAYEVLTDPVRRKQYDLGGGDSLTGQDAEVAGLIAELLFQFLDHLDVVHSDVIQEIRKNTMIIQQRFRDINTDLQVKIDRRQQVYNRVKRSSGQENVMQGLMLDAIIKLNQQIETNKREIDRGERILKFLEDYSYECILGLIQIA